MKLIFKNSFFMLLLVAVSTGYGQYKFDPFKEIREKTLSDAKTKAAAAKVLILGESYWLDETTWLLLGKLSFKEQTDYLKGKLYDNANMRKSAIDDASREVYGAEAAPQDVAYWDAKIVNEKKDWYATMVLANSGKLNANKDKKKLTIGVAYETVFGREPTASELLKWMKGTTHYGIIYRNILNYMYSTNGASELYETVKRTFTRINETFTDDQVKQRMVTAKNYKLDFMKMVVFFKKPLLKITPYR